MATTLMQVALISVIAGADLTGKEGYIVKPAPGGFVLAGVGETGFPLVVGGPAGSAVSIGGVGNVHKVVAGATVTEGARLKSDADGKVRDAVATSVSGAAVTASNCIGIAFSGGAADTLIEMLVVPMGIPATTAG